MTCINDDKILGFSVDRISDNHLIHKNENYSIEFSKIRKGMLFVGITLVDERITYGYVFNYCGDGSVVLYENKKLSSIMERDTDGKIISSTRLLNSKVTLGRISFNNEFDSAVLGIYTDSDPLSVAFSKCGGNIDDPYLSVYTGHSISFTLPKYRRVSIYTPYDSNSEIYILGINSPMEKVAFSESGWVTGYRWLDNTLPPPMDDADRLLYRMKGYEILPICPFNLLDGAGEDYNYMKSFSVSCRETVKKAQKCGTPPKIHDILRRIYEKEVMYITQSCDIKKHFLEYE